MDQSCARVDVRDMLCAQALALVAQAMDRVPEGHALTIFYNTEDVRRDLLAWAREKGHAAWEAGPVIHIEPRCPIT